MKYLKFRPIRRTSCCEKFHASNEFPLAEHIPLVGTYRRAASIEGGGNRARIQRSKVGKTTTKTLENDVKMVDGMAVERGRTFQKKQHAAVPEVFPYYHR